MLFLFRYIRHFCLMTYSIIAQHFNWNIFNYKMRKYDIIRSRLYNAINKHDCVNKTGKYGNIFIK